MLSDAYSTHMHATVPSRAAEREKRDGVLLDLERWARLARSWILGVNVSIRIPYGTQLASKNS